MGAGWPLIRKVIQRTLRNCLYWTFFCLCQYAIDSIFQGSCATRYSYKWQKNRALIPSQFFTLLKNPEGGHNLPPSPGTNRVKKRRLLDIHLDVFSTNVLILSETVKRSEFRGNCIKRNFVRSWASVHQESKKKDPYIKHFISFRNRWTSFWSRQNQYRRIF